MHLKSRKTPKLEFRSEDEAWYDVSLQLKAGAVKIHYAGFSHDSDELLRPEEFKSVEHVRSRFRFSSEQLQDQQCGRVTEGMAVCASCSSDGEDIRFFDAVVEQVYRSNHCVDSEDECRCAFVVLWLAGPHANERTTVYCENICLLTPGIIETHPVINALVKLLEEKTDCRTQSVGRNPLRKNVESTRDRLHVPGSVSTNFGSNQREPGQTTMEVESSCDLNELRKLNEQKDRPFETIEEAPTNASEYAVQEGNRAFAPEIDCAPHFSGPVSSQHKEKQGKSDQVNATEENHNNLGKLNKKRNMAFKTSEEAFSNVNEEDDQSFATKADCGPHFSGSISSQHKEEQLGSDKANATEKNHIDEALLITGNKLRSPLALKLTALHIKSISSQSKERQKKSDEVDCAERVLIGREVLCQELFASDNQNECLVRGVSDIGSDTNASSHLHRDTDVHLPKQSDDYGKMPHSDQDQSGSGTCSETNTCGQLDRNAGLCLLKQVDKGTKMRDCEGERNACMKDSIALGSSLSSCTMNIQDEIISKSSFDAPIDAATTFIQGKEKHFSSVDSLMGNSCEPPVCTATNSERKRTHLDSDDFVTGRYEARTDAATILGEGKGTDFNSIESLMRKEQSPSLPDLNSIPVDLETAHPCIPTNVVGINSSTLLYSSLRLSDTCIEDIPHAIGHNSSIFVNNKNLKDKRSGELDDNYGVIENERSCHGGFLESEDYDNPGKEDSGCQVAQSGMACKSSNLIVDGDISIQNKGHKLLENHEVIAYGDIEMLSSSLVPEHQDEGYDCERPLEMSSRQNAMVQEITENLGRKKVFLASSWGKGKRQKLKNTEMFINNERHVQSRMQNDECLQAWEKLASPRNDYEGIDTLRSNGSTMPLLESHKRKKPFDSSADFCDLPDKILKKEAKILNSDEVDIFQSSCLAASHLESQKRQEAVDISANLCELPDQICREVDEFGKAICCHGQHTKQVPSIKTQSQKIVPELVVISSDSENGHDVQDTISIEKSCHNGKDFRRQQKTCDAQLQDGLSATVEQRCECSGDLFALDNCKNGQLNCCSPYGVHSKECGDFAVHSPNVFSSSGSAEGDSNSDKEKDELCEVANCKHNNKFMKSREWSKRENERIQKVIVEEDWCTCMEQGVEDIYLETEYGHGNEDMRANQSQFSYSQVLMLDNLEKDVNSLDILDVISQATHGVVRVYIMPSLRYERFTRGFVFFKDRASLQRAAIFLQDNNFLIVSSRGRPWVVHHEVDGVIQGTSKASAIRHKGILPSWTTSSTKIVRKGTREYEKANKMKNLFLEFREHVALLHKRTEHEESTILL